MKSLPGLVFCGLLPCLTLISTPVIAADCPPGLYQNWQLQATSALLDDALRPYEGALFYTFRDDQTVAFSMSSYFSKTYAFSCTDTDIIMEREKRMDHFKIVRISDTELVFKEEKSGTFNYLKPMEP